MGHFEDIQQAALRTSLIESLSRWTKGVEELVTTVPNLVFHRKEAPTEPSTCLIEPSVGFVLQGALRAQVGEASSVRPVVASDLNHFVIASLNIPVTLQFSEASPEAPYLGLALKIDLRVMTDVIMQSGLSPPPSQGISYSMGLGDMTPPLLEAFTRLVRLLDEPTAIPVLAPLIQREIYFRLLMSDQGARLWQIASAGSHCHRISRAIDWLKSHYTQPLRIHELAAQVQMSSSSFHYHFRQLTTMTPVQFQKWLRLKEARRLMLIEDFDASRAAFQVGYESPSQFSREYRRMFGAAPRQDIHNLRLEKAG